MHGTTRIMMAALVVLACLAPLPVTAGPAGIVGEYLQGGQPASVRPAGWECQGFDVVVVDWQGQQACGYVRGKRLDIPVWRVSAKLNRSGNLAWSDGQTWVSADMPPRYREPRGRYRNREDECKAVNAQCIAQCNAQGLDQASQAMCWGNCNQAFVECADQR